jgi:hypothetical protein
MSLCGLAGCVGFNYNNKGGERNVSPVLNNNNVKKCLLEVPGVTGALSFLFFLFFPLFSFYFRHQRTDPGKKNNDGSGVAVRPTVRRIRTVPDGTEGENNANCVTKTQQHNTDRLALETTAVRMRRLAWSWSKLNNTTTTKTRLDLAWEGFHCNVHVFNCVAACVDVGGH